MAVPCIRKASGNNYRNSSVIVDLAMGQIPRSTESITSYYLKTVLFQVIPSLTVAGAINKINADYVAHLTLAD